jgi:hypothetical protein
VRFHLPIFVAHVGGYLRIFLEVQGISQVDGLHREAEDKPVRVNVGVRVAVLLEEEEELVIIEGPTSGVTVAVHVLTQIVVASEQSIVNSSSLVLLVAVLDVPGPLLVGVTKEPDTVLGAGPTGHAVGPIVTVERRGSALTNVQVRYLAIFDLIEMPPIVLAGPPRIHPRVVFIHVV